MSIALTTLLIIVTCIFNLHVYSYFEIIPTLFQIAYNVFLLVDLLSPAVQPSIFFLHIIIATLFQIQRVSAGRDLLPPTARPSRDLHEGGAVSVGQPGDRGTHGGAD